MQILEKAKKLLELEKTPSEMCRIYLQIIDHIYFKFDTRVIQQRHVSLTLNPALYKSQWSILEICKESSNDDKLCPAVFSEGCEIHWHPDKKILKK